MRTARNHNDCTAYRDSGVERQCRGAQVMADGGYIGNRQVIMPYRRPRDGGELLAWQVELNTVHKKIRARVEHAFAQMKWWRTSCATAAANATASTTPPAASTSCATWR